MDGSHGAPMEPDSRACANEGTVLIGGFDTAVTTRRALAARMVRDCLRAREQAAAPPRLVFSSNGQGVALAGEDPAFRALMRQADIVHADGMSVVAASRLLTRTPLPERIATTDFFHDAAAAAVPAGLRFFMLGGSETQNAAAVVAVRRLYPDLRIVGRRHGYVEPHEDADLCREIVDRGTDVLWVGMGKPRQERWSVENRDRLTGVGWIKTCGGLYAFLAGDAPRAPLWMRQAGLEWLFRAAREPRRLGWRYLTTNPYSIYRMVRHSAPRFQ